MKRNLNLVIVVLALAAAACGGGDAAPDRDATQDARGTSGREPGEITVTGCLALGQMGTFMLTSPENLPDGDEGFGRGAVTEGYQLVGEADDVKQYMDRRVRVTGIVGADRPADSDAPASARGNDRGEAPWPTLQVREIDPVEGTCSK